jgi:hypothetical protein
MQEKDCEWQNDQSYTETPYNDMFGPKPNGFLTKGKGKRRREDEVERTDDNQPIKRPRRQNTNVPSGSGLQPMAPVPSTSGPRSDGQGSSSDHSSSHSYQLRVRKQIFYDMSQQESETGGSGSGASDKTLKGSKKKRNESDNEGIEDTDAFKLTPQELDVVRRTVLHTIIPSWIDRVPQNLGSASHGLLKAAEWLILYKVYYIIALIPLWTRPAATAEERNQFASLLESTTLIAKIAHFLTLPKINPKDLDELDDLLLNYRKCLQKYWPSEPSLPNLHLTQHYPVVIRRFGPP